MQSLGNLFDTLHERYPTQPVGMSEYGAGAAISHHTDNVHGGPPEANNPGVPTVYQPEEYAAWVHEQNYTLLSSKPYIWGSFVWNMFDFATGLRNEGDTRGVNTKGLVTYDRQTRKDPFFFYQANWSPEPVLYITSRRYTDRAYPVADIKIYSNADEVSLSVNGREVGRMSRAEAPMNTYIFKAVRFEPGRKRITAQGERDGSTVRDSVEWRYDQEAINIACGQLASGLESSQGEMFGSDEFFIGGSGHNLVPKTRDPIADHTPISRTSDAHLFRGYRRGTFSYLIPVPDGAYEVTVRGYEPDPRVQPGGRVFDVVANGRAQVQNLDLVREAGAYRTVVSRTFPVEVSGGTLRLDFSPKVGEAIVSNIMVRAARAK
ncbi:MAG TPA: malectin domain-containing carbohydrate-binding protein [Phycisphaerales bacterium]|nr:malectin domain-containing carbohydrate-binding protein [Phycisphaerales bacterium]